MKLNADDLFESPLHQPEIDFQNAGGETYICSNPPYRGSQWQTAEQKADLKAIFDGRTKHWKSLDYVSGWFMKSADYGTMTDAVAALVSTNSICQGRQVNTLWPCGLRTGHEICFAHTSFKWANLAAHNAGVTVAIVGISSRVGKKRRLFSESDDGTIIVTEADNINPYLVPVPNFFVQPSSEPLNDVAQMQFGNHPYYGTPLIFSAGGSSEDCRCHAERCRFIRPLYGSKS